MSSAPASFAEARIARIIARRGSEFGRRDYRRVQALLADMSSDAVHTVEATTIETLWLVIAATDYVGDMSVEDLDR